MVVPISLTRIFPEGLTRYEKNYLKTFTVSISNQTSFVIAYSIPRDGKHIKYDIRIETQTKN